MTSTTDSAGNVKLADHVNTHNTPQPEQPRMTRDRPFGWLLVISGAIGWLASGALVLEKLEVLKNPAYKTACDINPWISCGQVMQTWQSSVFGFPNMFIGIVAFAGMIPLVVWVTARNITHGSIKVPAGAGRILSDFGWIITALLYTAVMASIFFAFIQVFIGTSGF